MKHTIELDILVVGAGPAGVAAATQAFRDRLAAALVTATPPGGMLWAARTLTNLPGFDHPLTGPILAKRLLESLRSTGMPVITDRVIALARHRDSYMASLAGGATIRSRAVVLATGTKPLPAPFDGWTDTEDCGRGHRDAATLPEQMTGQALAVVGGGDVAFDTALAARDRGADPVTILVRGSSPRAAMHLQAEAHSRQVTVHTQVEIRSIRPTSSGSMTAPGHNITVLLELDGHHSITADHVALCIGRQPADELLTEQLLDGNEPHPCSNARRTHVPDSAGNRTRPAWRIEGLPPGLWIAGDLASGASGRFVAWALGSGQQAASRAAVFLGAP